MNKDKELEESIKANGNLIVDSAWIGIYELLKQGEKLFNKKFDKISCSGFSEKVKLREKL